MKFAQLFSLLEILVAQHSNILATCAKSSTLQPSFLKNNFYIHPAVAGKNNGGEFNNSVCKNFVYINCILLPYSEYENELKMDKWD